MDPLQNPIEPIHFFSLGADLRHYKEQLGKKHLLPSLDSFYEEPPFAEVAMGWNEEGICVTVAASHAPIIKSDWRAGDAVELFFDTRDIKNSNLVHKFCHHFYFLPVLQQGENIVEAGEITRFHGEEGHTLADPKKFRLFCERKKGYKLSIFIPAEQLFGYDPLTFDRLGFTYRINRSKGGAQYFSLSQEEFTIEKHPSLWASLKLER